VPNRFVKPEKEEQEALKFPDICLRHDRVDFRIVGDHSVSVDFVSEVSILRLVDPTTLLDVGPEPPKISRNGDVSSIEIIGEPRRRDGGTSLLTSFKGGS
jgi:hypothetical protein